ncbi:MAG TPA: HD domain-containing phosphohydrolase [Gallionella sp.]|nr:HD domain-containing phosphohydrolase [Gallionella sp.]
MDEANATTVLRVLILEDSPTDAELMEYELSKAGLLFVAQRVDTEEAFVRALDDFHPDVILADYKLPAFSGRAALNIERRKHPEIPVVMVTGTLPDLEAVELLNAGAKDYVLKDRMARLAPAVQRVISAEQGIRARKAAEQALRESEAKFRTLVEATSDWIWEVDERGFYTYSSPQVYDVLGYAAEEIIGRSPLDFMPPEEAARVRDIFNAYISERKPFRLLENANVRKDGRVVCLETGAVPIFDGQGVFRGYRGIDRDITERKMAEKELQRLNRVLRALGAGNHALVHAENEPELLEKMCHAATEVGYVMAWVGYAAQDERKRVVPVAIAGEGKAYVEGLEITWDDTPFGRGPTGSAVRTGQVQIIHDIPNDPRMGLWQEAVTKYGYASSIALPLKIDGKVIGALTIYAAEPAAFGDEQVALLEQMADDLAFGIASLRTREERDKAVREREQYAEQLRTGLEKALEALSALVELRDPYTAGHQRSVAQLAVAIAREMGLPEEQIHGLHLAGIVHDLGKIRIPVEILSKPGILSDMELNLIRTHPQAGYDALKGIEFPWPIANIIWQHHERLDGSGYPRGLKNGDILLEAQILAVADVVVSIKTNRPYRPALGLDAALKEITDNRGKLFNPQVVDACLRLINEKGYTVL